jgi:hypothetical protein
MHVLTALQLSATQDVLDIGIAASTFREQSCRPLEWGLAHVSLTALSEFITVCEIALVSNEQQAIRAMIAKLVFSNITPPI